MDTASCVYGHNFKVLLYIQVSFSSASLVTTSNLKVNTNKTVLKTVIFRTPISKDLEHCYYKTYATGNKRVFRIPSIIYFVEF